MTFDEYQTAASRTLHTSLSHGEALASYALGSIGEVGELSELFIAGDVPARKVIDEGGDVCWYLAALATTLSVPLSRIATIDEANIHRYRSLGGRDLAVGLTLSAARICERVKKQVYHEKTCDIVGALGETMARVLTLAEDRGVTFREIAEFNIAKLKRRYEHGFTTGGGTR